MSKTTIQTTQETCRGVRLTIPKLTETSKSRLFLLSLIATRELIELDLMDASTEAVRANLRQSYGYMTQAIKEQAKQGGVQ